MMASKSDSEMVDTIRMTTAQAIVKFLTAQYSCRDGVEQPFFAGVFGIFGHGCLAGIGEALQSDCSLRYYQARNEQAMVHTAVGFAKQRNRLQTMACVSSIGPGATNMITAAATATINRIPVLLLPGDIFARRNVAPVLQQLESPTTQDISVNDCFKPVSKYWDRINRPEQIITSLMEAMRVLTSPEHTGAVTLSLPQDVQAEAFDYPCQMFKKRTWYIQRSRPDAHLMQEAIKMISMSSHPMIIAGGGVIYSEATEVLRMFVEATGIPVGETMAGKGSLSFDHPFCLGGIGVTGTFAADKIAREADLVIGIGTRYSDFTTASKTLFENPIVRFININVCEFDSFKHGALPLVGDARVILEEMLAFLRITPFSTTPAYQSTVRTQHHLWETEVGKFYSMRNQPLPSQAEIVGLINTHGDPNATIVCAAGSLPGDLHKLWRTRHAKQFHLEYGYSCMGYEIAGGLGVKMADPSREVYVLVGDGSYLMLANEIITSIQEGYKLTIILFDNDGFKSIGALSRHLGQEGFGTIYAFPEQGGLPSDVSPHKKRLPVDLAMNARSLGAHSIEAPSYSELLTALQNARNIDRTVVIHVPIDRFVDLPGYSFWDVPVAEVSTKRSVQTAHIEWAKKREKERYHM